MALDPRKQKQLKQLQNQGSLNARQQNRLTFLQGQQTGRPSDMENMPGVRPAPGTQRILPKKTRIKNVSSAIDANQQVQDAQAEQNFNWGNVDQYGIGGSRDFGIDPVTGQPYLRDSLSQEQQGLYDSENRLSQSGLDAAFGMLAQPGQGFDRNAMTDSVFRNLTRNSEADKMKEQQAMQQQLAERGIPVGSELYNNQMGELNRRYDDLNTSAMDRANQFSGEEMSRQTNIIGQLGQLGPGMRTPNFQGYQGTQVNYGDPTAIDMAFKQLKQGNRQLSMQQQALNRQGGGGGGGGAAPAEPQSPFIV